MDLHTIDIDGPIHYGDTGGPPDAPVAVLVHGLGASNLSWHPFVPLLAATHRVLAVDLVGAGHTEPAGRGSTVQDNRDHLARFLREVVDGPVMVVGNSMGGMIGIMLADAHPDLVETLVLVCPALPDTLSPAALRRIDPHMALHFALYNTPLVGKQFLRLRRHRITPAAQVHELLEMICTDPSRVPRDTVEQLVRGVEARRRYDWADAAFLSAERSVMRTLSIGRKRYLAAVDRLRLPTLLVHGEDDRLVEVSAARAVAPRNPCIQLVTLPDVGHAPQLEVPGELSAILHRWLAGVRQDVA